MVKLDRIYTRGGDGGETSLGDGARVPKSGLRITAIGEIDEANAVIGLARAEIEETAEDEDDELVAILAEAQNDLFDVGADLARPGSDAADGKLRISRGQVARLEAEIEALNADLAPLASFVLPGGSEAAARLHVARTVVRRAERDAVADAVGDWPRDSWELAMFPVKGHMERLEERGQVRAARGTRPLTGQLV